jgi:hypothetical protein
VKKERALNKWIVLSFVIPEVLVLGFIALMSPLVIGLGGASALPSYYFYGALCALIPGAIFWGPVWILDLLAGKPKSSK